MSTSGHDNDGHASNGRRRWLLLGAAAALLAIGSWWYPNVLRALFEVEPPETLWYPELVAERRGAGVRLHPDGEDLAGLRVVGAVEDWVVVRYGNWRARLFGDTNSDVEAGIAHYRRTDIVWEAEGDTWELGVRDDSEHTTTLDEHLRSRAR